MDIEINYRTKYIKYKTKYLKNKYILKGGEDLTTEEALYRAKKLLKQASETTQVLTSSLDPKLETKQVLKPAITQGLTSSLETKQVSKPAITQGLTSSLETKQAPKQSLEQVSEPEQAQASEQEPNPTQDTELVSNQELIEPYNPLLNELKDAEEKLINVRDEEIRTKNDEIKQNLQPKFDEINNYETEINEQKKEIDFNDEKITELENQINILKETLENSVNENNLKKKEFQLEKTKYDEKKKLLDDHLSEQQKLSKEQTEKYYEIELLKLKENMEFNSPS
jgi:hypothetical protein